MTLVLHRSTREEAASFHGLVGRHPLMMSLFDKMVGAALSTAPVLIEGPTGVGKELVARAVHDLSGVRGKLITINVPELPDQLLETSFFGSVKGAFTGALDKPGLLEEALHGTLYIDEAADLSRAIQAKLLRAIENQAIRRVGSTTERPVAFRLVLSVQNAVTELVESARWREDFRYRVDAVRLLIPRLKDRLSDVPLLVNHFLNDLDREPVGEDDVRDLMAHDWPGNVRQLRRVVERAVVIAAAEPLTSRCFIAALDTGTREHSAAESQPLLSLRAAIQQHIERALTYSGNSVPTAASHLGLSTSALYHRLRTLGICVPNGRALSQT